MFQLAASLWAGLLITQTSEETFSVMAIGQCPDAILILGDQWCFFSCLGVTTRQGSVIMEPQSPLLFPFSKVSKIGWTEFEMIIKYWTIMFYFIFGPCFTVSLQVCLLFIIQYLRFFPFHNIVVVRRHTDQPVYNFQLKTYCILYKKMIVAFTGIWNEEIMWHKGREVTKLNRHGSPHTWRREWKEGVREWATVHVTGKPSSTTRLIILSSVRLILRSCGGAVWVKVKVQRNPKKKKKKE